MPGIFIDVEVDDSIRDAGGHRPEARPTPARSTSSRTPTGTVTIVEANLDECVLCELCINAAPKGTVRVKKLYDGGVLE